MYRFDEGNLRLRQIMKNGKLIMKERWFKVKDLEAIKDTRFPDIKKIIISDDTKVERVAEVKFVTDAFNYHKSKRHDFKSFINNHGCIIVLKHSYLPLDLSVPIDIYEIDKIDFISFVKENFSRLLNRQIRLHEYQKIWLMIQSRNFYISDSTVPAANRSGRWCPSDNLTGFDLTTGDKVLFVKVGGAQKQKVNKQWSRNSQIDDKWTLEELYISEVISPIRSRYEYCMSNSLSTSTPLWYDETFTGKKDQRVTKRTREIRWKRVFEFSEIACLSSLKINLKELNTVFPEFVQAVRETYVSSVSRELPANVYTSVIEYLSMHENKEKLKLTKKSPITSYIQDDSQSEHTPIPTVAAKLC